MSLTASLSPCHWWTGIRCMCERLKPGPFSSSLGMKTRVVQGHVWVYIISGSTCLPIARLEVWSGTSYYYVLSRWNQNSSQSSYIFMERRDYTQSPPPLSTLQQYQHSIEWFPVTSHSSSSYDLFGSGLPHSNCRAEVGVCHSALLNLEQWSFIILCTHA